MPKVRSSAIPPVTRYSFALPKPGAGGDRMPPAPALRYAPAATWRSGYAAACKAVYTGSIPVVASRGLRYRADTFSTRVPQFLRPSGVWLDLGGMYSVAIQNEFPLGSSTAQE